MLCHRRNHASLSFHTVTLRFLDTELICVTRPSVVYTASCSPAYWRSLSFYVALFSRANSRLYIRKKCRSDSTISRRLLVNAENTVGRVIKFSRNLKVKRKRATPRYLLLLLNKKCFQEGNFRVTVPGIVIRENDREAIDTAIFLF